MDPFNPPHFSIPSNDENFIEPEINCNYYSPDDNHNVHDVINNSNSFSILTLNIRSLRKNFSSLLSFLSTYMLKFSLIILLETWLNKDIDNAFNIYGYRQTNLYRNKNGGGIKVYYSELFHIDILDECTHLSNVAEILTFIITCKGFKYLISCVYRPPGSNPNEFIDLFFNQIMPRFPLNSRVILAGDFNLNLYNPRNLGYINNFINNMLGHDFSNIVNFPTVINENNVITKYSLIDQIWINFGNWVSHRSGIIEYLITDRLPMFYVFSKQEYVNRKQIKYRLINQSNMLSFVDDFNNYDFTDIYSAQDPDTAFTQYIICTEILFPLRKNVFVEVVSLSHGCHLY